MIKSRAMKYNELNVCNYESYINKTLHHNCVDNLDVGQCLSRVNKSKKVFPYKELSPKETNYFFYPFIHSNILFITIFLFPSRMVYNTIEYM